MRRVKEVYNLAFPANTLLDFFRLVVCAGILCFAVFVEVVLFSYELFKICVSDFV